jgi:hypothetical protein
MYCKPDSIKCKMMIFALLFVFMSSMAFGVIFKDADLLSIIEPPKNIDLLGGNVNLLGGNIKLFG